MDFLQTLRAQVGGLLHIKSQLYWYGERGWDGTPDRICLVLDAAADSTPERAAAETATFAAYVRALLLIDGGAHWVWVGPEDVELIT